MATETDICQQRHMCATIWQQISIYVNISVPQIWQKRPIYIKRDKRKKSVKRDTYILQSTENIFLDIFV